jgi:cell division protein FtsN
VLFAPDDARVLGEYGKTLTAQGRSDDALAFLERAIELQPSDWSFFSAQGVAYDQKGAYQAAQASYERALSLKPGEPTVLNNAALSHMQTGDLDGAERLLEQATPGNADYPRIAQNLTLVRNLKAAHPQATVAAGPAPAPIAAVPVVPTPIVPPHVEAVAIEPPGPPSSPVAQFPDPVESPPLANVAPETEVADTAPAVLPKAAETEAEKPSRSLAQLQADPTVHMAPIPKPAPVAPPRTATAKPAAAPMKHQTAEKEHPQPPAKVASVHSQLPVHTAYYVQAGAYASEERAGKQAASLDSLGARVWPATVAGHALYRVRIGPFLDVKQASTAISQAKVMGQVDLQIVTEDLKMVSE